MILLTASFYILSTWNYIALRMKVVFQSNIGTEFAQITPSQWLIWYTLLLPFSLLLFIISPILQLPFLTTSHLEQKTIVK